MKMKICADIYIKLQTSEFFRQFKYLQERKVPNFWIMNVFITLYKLHK